MAECRYGDASGLIRHKFSGSFSVSDKISHCVCHTEPALARSPELTLEREGTSMARRLKQ
jgi:hypothetical protein